MKKILLILAAVSLTACTSADEATRALNSAGYTNIQITGFKLFGCSEDDTFRTGFKATGKDGNPVEGTVCSAFLKGATIRTD